MSSVAHNQMGPVLEATPEIQALGSRPDIKHAAIHKLHQIHKANTVHHFHEHDMVAHIANWTVVQYAEEKVAYGINYFMKVNMDEQQYATATAKVLIAPGHYLHMRLHRQQHHDVYDFYSLHQTIKHNEETCLWTLEEPLVYFNA